MSSMDSPEVFVAQNRFRRGVCIQIREHRLLHREVLDDRFRDEIGVLDSPFEVRMSRDCRFARVAAFSEIRPPSRRISSANPIRGRIQIEDVLVGVV
jgi:hypothetical protein